MENNMRRVTILLAVMTCLLTGCRPASTADTSSFISTGDGGWEWVKPTPTGHHWLGDFFLDDKTGWEELGAARTETR
jgi:hypothetical protein